MKPRPFSFSSSISFPIRSGAVPQQEVKMTQEKAPKVGPSTIGHHGRTGDWHDTLLLEKIGKGGGHWDFGRNFRQSWASVVQQHEWRTLDLSLQQDHTFSATASPCRLSC
ncbi:hypothetical protein ACQJBY_026894 [Aegilops geniculata]